MQIDSYFNTIKEMSKFANKELGQNYLIDQEIAKKIVNFLDINDKDDILEIGSGFGSLSIFMLEKPYKTITFNDIDPRSIEYLDQLTANKRRAYVVNKSALKLSVSTYSKIIGNLPYYITNDLLEHLLTKGNASKYVFMVQKEVTNRINAKVGSEEYGPLAVLTKTIGVYKSELNVNKSAFMPQPHIDSTVFSISINKNNKFDKYKYLQFLKRMFLHRRKTIYNNLSLYLMNKDKAKEVLEKLKISILTRPEQIDPQTYMDIFNLCI